MAATLIIQRSGEFLNRFRNIEILVDGKRAGKVAHGSTIQLELQPGMHNVRARIDWAGSNAVDLELAEGETQALLLTGFRGAKWLVPVALLLVFGLWAIDFARKTNFSLYVSIPILLALIYILTIGRKKYLKLTPIPSINSATS